MPLDLHIDRDALVEHLGHANRVIERKPGASPALLCVRLVATDEGLVLTATDTELAYRGTVACAVASPGALALDARELFQMARSLPEPTVRIRTAPLGKAEVRSGRSKFRMSAMPTDDLPPILGAQDIAELPSERIEGELSKFLLRGVRPSRGIDLLRHLDRDGLPGLAAPPRTWDRRCAALDRYVAMRPADRGAALAEGWTLLTLGASPTDREALLRRVRPPQAVQAATVALAMTAPPPPDPARLRALAWSLRRAGVSLASVFRVAEAQGFAVPGRAVAASVGVLDGPLPSVVQGRDLLARGMTPGPEVGGLIARCRQVQDEFGLDDVDQILARVAPTLAN